MIDGIRDNLLSVLDVTSVQIQRQPSGDAIVFPKTLALCGQLPRCPPQSEELRFKKCDSVQQFSSGEDLSDAGLNCVLYLVQSSARKQCVDELLVKPGLFDRELVADLQGLVRDSKPEGHRLRSNATTLYDIDQPFVFDLYAMVTMRV
ncbi:hypothetical protein M413DRAFT_344945 [Hebeloma cylindrosporum]|uniref:Uncharacterized protein n=1 Tax=Hebeloma cylindrosporum TaxID=76867 RepID=A0A0C3CNK2_HEBCY|nr:hypothetical protein M413DRAFT_344945 [Hebeloma cylindrosporum h7]